MFLKTLVLTFQVIVELLMCRPFGKIIYDIAQRYNGINICKLRKFEKLQ